MLRLVCENHERILYAEVFIEEGERAVGVVLREDGESIATLRLDEREEEEDAVGVVIDWMMPFNLLEDDGVRLIEAVIDEFRALEEIRASGPDITHGWLGSPSSRRLPDLMH